MNNSIRNVCVALAIVLPVTGLAQASAKDTYLEAYTNHMMKNAPLIVQGMMAEGMTSAEAQEAATAFMQHAIACHASALDTYPEELKQAMFSAVADGGSYPDAESALKVAVGEAQFGGNEAVIQGFIAASEQMMACLEGAGS